MIPSANCSLGNRSSLCTRGIDDIIQTQKKPPIFSTQPYLIEQQDVVLLLSYFFHYMCAYVCGQSTIAQEGRSEDNLQELVLPCSRWSLWLELRSSSGLGSYWLANNSSHGLCFIKQKSRKRSLRVLSRIHAECNMVSTNTCTTHIAHTGQGQGRPCRLRAKRQAKLQLQAGPLVRNVLNTGGRWHVGK